MLLRVRYWRTDIGLGLAPAIKSEDLCKVLKFSAHESRD